MRLSLSPVQISLRKGVREFAESEIAPQFRASDAAQTSVPLDSLRAMGTLGYMESILPESVGGVGLGYGDYFIIVEEPAHVELSIGLVVAVHTSLCVNHILAMGSKVQRNKYVPLLVSSEWIDAWALKKPDARSEAVGIRTWAFWADIVRILNEAKIFTNNVYFADICVVMAITDRFGGKHGIFAFIFEENTDGFGRKRKECKMGMHASIAGEVFFEHCKLPSVKLFGKSGEGLWTA
jgi:alkylation response protein AidB-like acyl-CoA dehydrogenase